MKKADGNGEKKRKSSSNWAKSKSEQHNQVLPPATEDNHMKSLKKKVCVSVFLDELFELVDDEDYLRKELRGVRRGDTRIQRSNESRLLSNEEEFLLEKITQRSKYRDTLRIAQENDFCLRDEAERLRNKRPWSPPVMKEMDEVVQEKEEDASNDFDVDEYSESDLRTSDESLNERVDIALSTSFIRAAECGSGQKTNGSTQTCDLQRSTHLEILNDLANNKKCFLVARCAKSMNLTAMNHKSTQFTFPSSQSEPMNVDHSKHSSREAPCSRNLQELYNYMDARRHSVRVLKRVNHIVAKKSVCATPTELIHPPSERKAEEEEEEVKTMSLWKKVPDSDTKIVKKGFCDVTVKTLMKTSQEYLCYTLSIPWEVNTMGEFIIPPNALKSHDEDSLALFRTRRESRTELSTFLVGTQCDQSLAHTSSDDNTISIDISINEETPEEAKLVSTGDSAKTYEIEVPETEHELTDTIDVTVQNDQSLVRALAPQIIEEMKVVSLRREVFVDKAMNTDPPQKLDEDLTVEWELEIEIQNDDVVEGSAKASKANSNAQMIKAIEGASDTNVILVCQPPPPREDHPAESCSRNSCVSEVEQCYLKDEKIRKMYLANVPRHLLHVTEERLKEIGRG